MAIPCATQNKSTPQDQKTLLNNRCIAVAEGANIPTMKDGIDVFKDYKIPFAPSKAANARGVAVSGLEMSQNSARMSWSEQELQQPLKQPLKQIMKDTHDKCVHYGKEQDYINHSRGANLAGFIKVVDAMLAYGVI